jgi:hypothetical protein
VQLGGRPVETDLSGAAWVAEALAAQPPDTVAALVPPVFEAHARVLHPAVRYVGLDDVHVPWAEVARANATTVHPAAQWGALTGSTDFYAEDNQSPLWDDAPAMGHLPEHVAATLAAVLRRHTTTPGDCWFALSVAVSRHAGGDPAVPTLAAGGRAFWLVRGPVETAAANLLPEPASQSANAWWPADRAWFVATDIDQVSTYVGGSAACVADLLASGPGAGLEVLAVPASQRTTEDADTVNPEPF